VRNDLATRVIEGYASRPPKLELPLGMASNFLPGGALVKFFTSLAVQARGQYQVMVRDLAVIYSIPVTALGESVLRTDEHSTRVGLDLAAAFSQQVLTNLLTDMAPDLWLNVAAGMVPILGRMAGGSVDAAITATLTWQIATMAVLYLLNGNAWLGDQPETARLARQIVGKPNGQARGRVRLDDLPFHAPSVYWRLVDGLVEDIQDLRRTNPSLTPDGARVHLQGLGVRDDQIDSALAQC
jgi:uncharacterized protein (DUF697 family)